MKLPAAHPGKPRIGLAIDAGRHAAAAFMPQLQARLDDSD